MPDTSWGKILGRPGKPLCLKVQGVVWQRGGNTIGVKQEATTGGYRFNLLNELALLFFAKQNKRDTANYGSNLQACLLQ